MPRGNPGKLVALRLDPALVAAVKENAPNMTRAVEEGLRLWLAKERRKAKSPTHVDTTGHQGRRVTD